MGEYCLQVGQATVEDLAFSQNLSIGVDTGIVVAPDPGRALAGAVDRLGVKHLHEYAGR